LREALGWHCGSRSAIQPGDAPRCVQWLCGALLLCRTELIQRLSGFDPRFFLYFEETDLCRRAGAAGAELWAVGTAVAEHAGSASTRQAQRDLPEGGYLSEHYYRSRYYYLIKHHGRVAAAATEICELGIKAGRDAARWLLGRAPARELSARLQAPVLRLPPNVA
jgi:hypothetical protein